MADGRESRPARRVPHVPQKLEPATRTAPHGHLEAAGGASGAPHGAPQEPQNLSPSETEEPHEHLEGPGLGPAATKESPQLAQALASGATAWRQPVHAVRHPPQLLQNSWSGAP